MKILAASLAVLSLAVAAANAKGKPKGGCMVGPASGVVENSAIIKKGRAETGLAASGTKTSYRVIYADCAEGFEWCDAVLQVSSSWKSDVKGKAAARGFTAMIKTVMPKLNDVDASDPEICTNMTSETMVWPPADRKAYNAER